MSVKRIYLLHIFGGLSLLIAVSIYPKNLFLLSCLSVRIDFKEPFLNMHLNPIEVNLEFYSHVYCAGQ